MKTIDFKKGDKIIINKQFFDGSIMGIPLIIEENHPKEITPDEYEIIDISESDSGTTLTLNKRMI
jgi:hypothetical protein